jgi:hypothetical protein
MDTFSAPSPGPNPVADSKTGYTAQPAPTAQPTETFEDSGMVRVVETLGFESDTIDCPYCGRRGQTVVEKRASKATT